MNTLTGSSLKGVCLEKEKWSLFWYQKPEICFLQLPSGRHNGKFTLFSSVESKTILPLFAASSALSSSASNSQTQFEGEELEPKDEFKTAHVRFQLERECSFGEQFLIVGDDPVLGSWNPSNAVPLTWSDGHVWTVEMDIPREKPISYKFILIGADNTILWQPGPDRILKAWETSNTITVCEDWDNADLQKIMEEILTGEPDDSPVNSEVLIDENSTQERIDTNSNANEPVRIVADNITGAKEDDTYVEEKVETGPCDFGNNENLSSKDETFDEGVPVLVPGLHQTLSMETEAMPSDETQIGTVAEDSIGSSEAEELKLQEHLKLKSDKVLQIDSSHDKETSETMLINIRGIEDNGHVQGTELEEYHHHNTQKVEAGVMESDLQWGRKTIKKFLTNLGLWGCL